jgi:hypothetical protein
VGPELSAAIISRVCRLGQPAEGHQTEHPGASATPHLTQKRRSARLSWLQDLQRIAARLASGDYHAGRKPLNGAPRGAVGPQESSDSAALPAFGPGHAAIRQVPVRQLTPDRLPESDPLFDFR